MEIKKLFGTQDTVQSSGLKKQKDLASRYEQGRDVVLNSGDDVVRLSSLSRQLSQVSQVLREDEEQRAKRVADIKQQVQDGSYSVNSADVARSIISFARDLPPSGDA